MSWYSSIYIPLIIPQEIAHNLGMDITVWDLKKVDTSLDLDMKIQERKYPIIAEEYHKYLEERKEIDFDLILNIAHSILKSVSYL